MVLEGRYCPGPLKSPCSDGDILIRSMESRSRCAFARTYSRVDLPKQYLAGVSQYRYAEKLTWTTI